MEINESYARCGKTILIAGIDKLKYFKQTTDDDNVYSDIDDDPMSREADDLLSRAQRN